MKFFHGLKRFKAFFLPFWMFVLLRKTQIAHTTPLLSQSGFALPELEFPAIPIVCRCSSWPASSILEVGVSARRRGRGLNLPFDGPFALVCRDCRRLF